MPRLEKIRYKPISIREVLTEMKDLSELMLDLAYSAVLFNNAELAEEVMDMERRVDTLSYLLNMNAMIAVRDAEDAEDLVSVPSVAAATNEISDAAADIANLVLTGIGIHPIIREAFRGMEEQLVRTVVKSDSFLAGKRLEMLDLAARIGVDIIAIRRGKRWIINPEEDEAIHENDVLIARGAPGGVEKLREMAGGTT